MNQVAPQPNFKKEVSMDEMRKKRLFLAVPMYGGNCVGTFSRAMIDLGMICATHRIDLKIYYLFNESLVTRARNYCVDEFMRSDSTHFMFIDSDISFNPGDIMGMLSMMDDDSPFDILCGPYPKKCISWEKIKMAVDKGFADQDPNVLDRFVGDYVFNPKFSNSGRIPVNQPVEVLEGGTGFMMIKRSAFQTFLERYPQYMYRPDHVRTAAFDGTREIMQYFQAEIDGVDFSDEYRQILLEAMKLPDGHAEFIKLKLEEVQEKAQKRSKRYLSEDYWFCQKAQQAGLKVWLCPWIKLQHTGSYIFGGSLLDIAQLGASPTVDPSQIKKIGEVKQTQSTFK